MRTWYMSALFVLVMVGLGFGGGVFAQERGADPERTAGAGAVDADQDRDRDRTQAESNAGEQPRESDNDPVQDRQRYQDQTAQPVALEELTATATDPTELRMMIQHREEELAGEARQAGKAYQEMMEHQNRIREAVHAVLAAEDLMGQVGPRARELAREVNACVQNTVRFEQRIEDRGAFTRFFFGGDEEAARALAQEREEIREHVREMRQLVDDCPGCGEEVKTMLQEQVREMEQEQERLRQVAEEELERDGLFGFLFGWMR